MLLSTVYADQVPPAEVDGFSAPGPSIHTGSAAPSEVPSAASLLDSTVHGASLKATEGLASEVMSIDSGAIPKTGIGGEAGSSDFEKVDPEFSLGLDSSAETIEDISFDDGSGSDGGNTVVVNDGEVGDLGEFEELNVNERREINLPVREKRAVA